MHGASGRRDRAVTFLNPLLLLGLAGLAVPVVIHLMMNRKVTRIRWAAMQFLQTSVQRRQKRMNLEDILLLVLRCLLLLLLALALARPASKGESGAAGSGPATVVLALDHSYSMAEIAGSGTRFDLAKQAAEAVLDGLPSGSSVAVTLFSDRVRAVIAQPTFDLNLARKVIREATLEDRPTDVEPAVRQALETLAHRGANAGAIYCFTDGQALGWARLDSIRSALGESGTSATVVLVGDAPTPNLAVSDLRLASGLAAVGTPLRFQITVSNFGSAEAKDVPVSLSLDGEPPCDEGVIASILPGQSGSLALFGRFRAAGFHTVTGRTAPDALPLDDRRSVALGAVEDVQVLLVDGDPQPGRDAETFYLRNAFTPVAAAALDNYHVKTRTVAVDEMSTVELGDFDAVVLANVPRLPTAQVSALDTYVRRGGG